jgi:predicted amidophosphoribosyltransferase
MATVGELSAPYANFMLNPASPEADGVCEVCLTFTSGFSRCYRCAVDPQFVDAVLPISYSVHFGQLHNALHGYKRRESPVSRRLRLELAAVLWRFLTTHEPCLAQRVGVEEFEVVTTVPSGLAERDEQHPLRHIVCEVVTPTSTRYERLLTRSAALAAPRVVDLAKFEVHAQLTGRSVLLIDDTWTTGSSIQSAAAALRQAGAATVGVVVIGRHIHEDYANNASRLREISRPFSWDECAFE